MASNSVPFWLNRSPWLAPGADFRDAVSEIGKGTNPGPGSYISVRRESETLELKRLLGQSVSEQTLRDVSRACPKGSSPACIPRSRESGWREA